MKLRNDCWKCMTFFFFLFLHIYFMHVSAWLPFRWLDVTWADVTEPPNILHPYSLPRYFLGVIFHLLYLYWRENCHHKLPSLFWSFYFLLHYYGFMYMFFWILLCHSTVLPTTILTFFPSLYIIVSAFFKERDLSW